MRCSSLVTSLLLLVTACGVGTPEEEAAGSTTSAVSSYGSCSLSREAILASASASRQRAIERGFGWLDAEVPYSQSARHEGYRTDCSGFVSMCWELSQPGLSTGPFRDGASNVRLSSYEDLLPADALVRRSGGSGHIVLFLGWNDDAHTSACVLEQASTASDMQFRARSVAGLEGEGYVAIRSDALANDTTMPDARVGDGTTPKAPDAEPSCPTEAQTCAAAAVECGAMRDTCGRVVDCSKVPTLGCSGGTTCIAGRCMNVPSTCTPKTAAEACRGVSACKAPDGCGGTVVCECADAPSAGSTSPTSKDPGDPGDPGDSPASKGSTPRRATGANASSAGCSVTPGTQDAPRNGAVLVFAGIVAALRRRARARVHGVRPGCSSRR